MIPRPDRSLLPDHAWDRVNVTLDAVKARLQNADTALAAGIKAHQIFDLTSDLSHHLQIIDRAQGVAGLGAFVESQMGDPAGLDYAAELEALRLALVAVLDEVAALLPVDADGYLLLEKVTRDGLGRLTRTERIVPAGAAATLRAAVQTALAAIE